ncbi:pirin family protein [Pseudomonas arsenicoxydans]|uniref:Pirin family protein n=1 Tax=Pseudomonas arsenicoxydans TaxID=702115 RepID=A0A502HLT2_9PSED|nr:pirin family protein [Pseudomonas arsenicoxydans]TPG74663.1 pirin family protein [Pseudomonas arsenicoxydans]
MLEIRKAGGRGSTRLPWLKSRHTFSFGGYKDPQEMGFSDLRVINDDWVVPGKGFGQHAHRDVEILTYVLQGTLAHRDSLNNSAKIKTGDFQLISAGSGIEHSEFNASSTQPVHFLQIWLTPHSSRTKPNYQQKHFPVNQRRGKLQLIASKSGQDGSLKILQDAKIYAGQFGHGDSFTWPVSGRRHVYIHVVTGKLKVNGETVAEGDGLKLTDEPELTFTQAAEAQVLVFELRAANGKPAKRKPNGICSTQACAKRK